MSLIPYYLQFVSEICEGKRPLPEGFALHETDDLKKAVELQTQIQTVGIPEFVRRCAAQTGESIPQADYDAFDPNDLNAAIAQLAAERAPEPDEPAEPAEPVKTETRDIFEVFLDSVCLEDEIFRYLIDILRRGADGALDGRFPRMARQPRAARLHGRAGVRPHHGRLSGPAGPRAAGRGGCGADLRRSGDV